MDIPRRVGLLVSVVLFAGCTYSVQWRAKDRTTIAAAEANRPERTAKTLRVAPAPAPARDDEAACYAALNDADVSFERIAESRANGVSWPIQLLGPVGGVRIYGGKKDAPTNYLDCRLARALLAWAPLLRAQGVVGLQHYSMYRNGATVGQSNKVSGHASGRAIDVAFFETSDGRKLSVLNDWTSRTRGADPCDVSSPKGSAERLMRDLVCKASERELFQMVLTPHYNDAHRNHVHLEIDPRGGGSWVG